MSLKEPARVYISSPFTSTWKKPSPSTATSRALPVFWKSPWVKNLCTAVGRTPMPTWMPTGSRLSPSVMDPAIFMVWYIRSSNSARLFLKPVVLTLARLLEMTSMLSCWATMPVAPVYRERIMGISPSLSHAGGPRAG